MVDERRGKVEKTKEGERLKSWRNRGKRERRERGRKRKERRSKIQ